MIFKNRIEDKIAEAYVEQYYDKAKKVKKKVQQKSMIRDLIDNPDGYELNAKIEDGEFVIKIKRSNVNK